MHDEHEVDRLSRALTTKRVVVEPRIKRYQGTVTLRYCADRVESADLRRFHTNLYRVAVDSVAERMRVRGLNVMVKGTDLSEQAWGMWLSSQMDQLAPSMIREALSAGVAQATVVTTTSNRARMVPESTTAMVTETHPITGEVLTALKRWEDVGPDGVVREEYAAVYDAREIRVYRRDAGGWSTVSTTPHTLGMCPVVTVTNRRGLSGTYGWSVIDDLSPLVDALSKVLSDMLVASEDVARPRRWASGIDLEEDDGDDGFVADLDLSDGSAPAPTVDDNAPVMSPFEDGSRMWTTESADAKFGQLPGADLKGYETAAALLRTEIMAVASLPAHLMGVTTANPASADATRAAELSLTAAAEAAMSVIGLGIEDAVRLMVASETGHHPHDVQVRVRWCRPDTRSEAQDADATTKLFSLGLLTVEEARSRMRVDDYA